MAINPRVVLRYFHISIGSDHFYGAKNFEIQYFLEFSEKLIIFGDMKIQYSLAENGHRLTYENS